MHGNSTYEPRRDEVCALVIEVFSDGHGIAEFSSQVGINKCTFHEWKKFDDFAAAYELAKIKGLAWWERKLRAGILDRNFNERAWTRQVFNRFRKEYSNGSYVCLEDLAAPGLSEMDVIKKGLTMGRLSTEDALKISQTFLNLAKTEEMSEMAIKLNEIEAKLDEFKNQNSTDPSLSL